MDTTPLPRLDRLRLPRDGDRVMSSSVSASARQFATTRWTAVLAAAKTDSPRGAEALDQLCRTYWYPLYAWIRRQGYAPHDAQDLIQGYFARLLERDDLATVHPSRGKFRSFLLASLKHYMANERDRAQAWKRGGRHEFVPLDTAIAESRYGVEPALTPDQVFDRGWALTVLEQVLTRLRTEFRLRGREAFFEKLKSCLTGSRLDQPYARLAVELGVTESAVKVAVHRLRHRYRALLEDEIAQTVEDPGEVQAELHQLLELLRS